MNKLSLYQIDAFTDKRFRGNPAAVCPLDRWLHDGILQQIAQENNLSETAFVVQIGDRFHLRWFTPRYEVDLCGHATLAAAHVIFQELGIARESIRFETRSGPLEVSQDANLLSMNLPALSRINCAKPPAALLRGLGIAPIEIFKVDADKNYFAIYPNERDIKAIQPDLYQLEHLHPYGVAVSSPGKNSDIVSRYFAPSYGIPEDPVTGSIHCALVPYWAGRLGKLALKCRQLSQRGGELACTLANDRVIITGQAVKYFEGTIWYNDDDAID